MILGARIKPLYWCCLLALMPTSVIAEGIIDFKPYLSATVMHDDNLFRFASPTIAKAAIGRENAGDVLKSLELGFALNLRLSRQLIVATASVTENKYDRFKNLDNRGNSQGLRWDWRLGSDIYGDAGMARRESIASFDQTRSPLKNLQTSDRAFASINWDFLPDWTVRARGEHDELNNALAQFRNNDRQDDIYEVGLAYHNRLETQLGVAYRVNDSSFPGRDAFFNSTLGSASSQNEILVTAGWQPSSKVKLNTRLSDVSLSRSGSSLQDLNGLSQHWGVQYSPTFKLNFNLDVFRDIAPQNDVVTTYVKATGFTFDPTWNVTSKLVIRGNAGYTEQTFLGSASLSPANIERVDNSILAGLSIIYAPTLKSTLQLAYQGEKRTSNIQNFGYRFNNLNLTFRYDY